MATTPTRIILKHSFNAGESPDPATLRSGEIAINATDQKIFFLDEDGNLVSTDLDVDTAVASEVDSYLDTIAIITDLDVDNEGNVSLIKSDSSTEVIGNIKGDPGVGVAIGGIVDYGDELPLSYSSPELAAELQKEGTCFIVKLGPGSASDSPSEFASGTPHLFAYLGPDNSPEEWDDLGAIAGVVGPQGDTGATGPTGPQGPVGPISVRSHVYTIDVPVSDFAQYPNVSDALEQDDIAFLMGVNSDMTFRKVEIDIPEWDSDNQGTPVFDITAGDPEDSPTATVLARVSVGTALKHTQRTHLKQFQSGASTPVSVPVSAGDGINILVIQNGHQAGSGAESGYEGNDSVNTFLRVRLYFDAADY